MALPKTFVQAAGLNQLVFDSSTQTLLFQVQVKNSATGKHVIVAYDFADGKYPSGPCDTRALTDETARALGDYSMHVSCDGSLYMSGPLGLEKWSLKDLATQTCEEDTGSSPCDYKPTTVINSAVGAPIDMVESGAESMTNGGLIFASDASEISQSRLDGTNSGVAISNVDGSVRGVAYAAAEDVVVAEVRGGGANQIWQYGAKFATPHTVLLSGSGDDTRENADWRRGALVPLHVLYVKNSEYKEGAVGSGGSSGSSSGGATQGEASRARCKTFPCVEFALFLLVAFALYRQ